MAILQVTLKGTILGQTHINVFHFNRDPFGAGDLVSCADTVAANWLNAIKTFVPAEFFWQVVTVRNLDTPTVAPHVKNIVIQGTSSSIGGGPLFSCFLLRFQTATAGRSGRGRYYQSSPNSGHIVAGQLTNPVVTVINTSLNSLMASFGPSGGTNFKLVIIPRSNPAAFKPVIAMTVDTIPRVQRRRNIGVGV